MAERRIHASHPDYEKLNDLADKIARAQNPHMHLGKVDLDETMCRVLVAELEAAMEKELEGGPFADFLNQAAFTKK